MEIKLLNPLVVEVMKEIGMDLSNRKTKSVQEMLQEKEEFHYVITVCDEAGAERCPQFRRKAKKIHWSFPDPSSFSGDLDERREKTRQVRDQIKQKIEEWVKG